MPRPKGKQLWRRICITVPDSLLKKVDAVCGKSRSAYIVKAVEAYKPSPAAPDRDDSSLRAYLRKAGGRHFSEL